MKNARLISVGLIALLLAAVLPGSASASVTTYYETVSATQTNATSTFSFGANVLNVYNDGINEAWIKFDGAAVGSGSTNIQIPAGRGKAFTFPTNSSVATLGVICSSGETTTVRIEAYSVSNVDYAFSANEIKPVNDLSSAVSLTSFTASGTATMSGTILATATSTQGNTTVKALTAGSATTFATVTVPSGSTASGMVEYALESGDGTEFQNRSGLLEFRCANKAGTTTCQLSRPGGGTTVDNTTDAVISTSGTLTNTFTTSDGGSGVVSLKANAASSLTETFLNFRYRVRALAATTLVVAAQ